MCGIVAALGEAAPRSALLADIGHRGPDHLGWIAHGPGFLGAARLRITDDFRGDMPLRSRSGLVSLVANGEIFNHRELFPCTGSDLRGLADLWEQRGVTCLADLRGPFALAVWDRRDQSLTIARDEYGVRPLHYALVPEGVLVASEFPAVANRLSRFTRDDLAWDHLLAFHFLPSGRTTRREVRSLEPGTWRRFSRRGGDLVETSGRFEFQAAKREALSTESLASAVGLQVASPLRSGIFLSGGLDSSGVLGLLHRAAGRPNYAIGGYFPDGPPQADERPYARAVARELGIELVEVAIDADAHWSNLHKLIAAHGGPEAGPGGPSAWCLAETAARLGVRVVFTGQGGDELFGGYERHRQIASRWSGQPLSPASGYESLLAGSSDPVSAALFRGREYWDLLEPERRAGVTRAATELSTFTNVEEVLEFEIRTLLPGLLAVDDRALGAFGIEGRVPLLDPGLARLARQIPFLVKSPARAPRELFRELLGPALPMVVRQRTDKMGFPVPLEAWLAGPWRGRLSDSRVESSLQDLGFNRAALRRKADQLSPRARWFLLAAAVAAQSSGANLETGKHRRVAHAE